MKKSLGVIVLLVALIAVMHSVTPTAQAGQGDPNDPQSGNYQGYEAHVFHLGGGNQIFYAQGRFQLPSEMDQSDPLGQVKIAVGEAIEVRILPVSEGFAQLAAGAGIMRAGEVVDVHGQFLGKATVYFTAQDGSSGPQFAAGYFNYKCGN